MGRKKVQGHEYISVPAGMIQLEGQVEGLLAKAASGQPVQLANRAERRAFKAEAKKRRKNLDLCPCHRCGANRQQAENCRACGDPAPFRHTTEQGAV